MLCSALDDFVQLLEIERLVQVEKGACLEKVGRHNTVAERAVHDRDDLGAQRLEALDELKPVDFRHHDIRHHDIDVFRFHLCNGLHGIGSLLDSVSFETQKGCNQFPGLFVVIGNQDPFSFHRSPPLSGTLFARASKYSENTADFNCTFAIKQF